MGLVNLICMAFGIAFWMQSGELAMGVMMWVVLYLIGGFIYACFVHPILVLLGLFIGASS